MKVKIVKCSHIEFWYKDRVGEIFDAIKITEKTNVYGNMYKLSNSNYVLVDDCVDIVEVREEKLNDILNENLI